MIKSIATQVDYQGELNPIIGQSVAFVLQRALMPACVSPGGADGGGAEEGAGQQQHVGENEEQHGVRSERSGEPLCGDDDDGDDGS